MTSTQIAPVAQSSNRSVDNESRDYTRLDLYEGTRPIFETITERPADLAVRLCFEGVTSAARCRNVGHEVVVAYPNNGQVIVVFPRDTEPSHAAMDELKDKFFGHRR